MGGRGGSSGLGYAGIEVRYGNGQISSFRDYGKGRVTDLDGFNVKNTNGLTVREIAERARANGYDVKAYSASELRARDRARNERVRNKPDYELGVGVDDNRAYRKAARNSRLATRMQRHKR